ncbi:MAG: polysaccharide deacetylase family protein, partial [Acetanaerobacterium sp.]
YGFAACIAVVPALVGTPGYVTYEQLAEVYMSGWDTLNHTYDHMNLKSLPVKMQREQILKARDWLNAQLLNRGSDIVVYPEGGFSDQTVMLLKDEGFAAGRSLNSLWTAHNDCTLEDAETCNLLSDMPLDAAKSAIDKAMDFHSTLIIILHKIEPVTADTQMQIEADFFRGVAQYLHDNSDKLNVITMTELLACNKTAR